MKTYALLFAWIPVSMAFMGTGQPGFGLYLFWTLALIGAGINLCAWVFFKESRSSIQSVTDEMKLSALRSTSQREWEQRCLAYDLFMDRGAR